MSINVEKLENLERKINLTVPANEIKEEIAKRLRKLAKNVKMDGFRPGKVPMSVVEQRYGYSVQHEVLNDKVAQVFYQTVSENEIAIAGSPRIQESKSEDDQVLQFEAIFEVPPEVDLSAIEKISVEKITEPKIEAAAIDKTLTILRKQYRTFAAKTADEAVADGDRVEVDFEGKIDGEVFEGGKATGFKFIVGEGQMLKEFNAAVIDMKTGDSKTFPLTFPENYHGKDVAGKKADFMVTVKGIEKSVLPELDEKLIKSLGVEDGTLKSLKKDIKDNLKRETTIRTFTLNKSKVMDALVKNIQVELPKSSVHDEIHRLADSTRADLRQRGMKDVEKVNLPDSMFQERAEQRVKLSFILLKLVKDNALKATDKQVQDYIKQMAASYEKPEELIQWYNSDENKLAEVRQIVLENNVVDFVLSKVQVTEKEINFDDLMTQTN